VVDELQDLKCIRIKGTLRRVLEYVAKCNLSKEFPISRDIGLFLRLNYDATKALLKRAVDNGLLISLPPQKGHWKRYVLANLQDCVVDELQIKCEPKQDLVELSQLLQNTHLQLTALDDRLAKCKLMFHHISLISELNDREDYIRLNWNIVSKNNRGKIFKLRLSRHRTCNVIIYPNGTCLIYIECSKEPFDLFSDPGLYELHSICGEIQREIKFQLSNFSPLRDEVFEWGITQIDGAYDIPIDDINKHGSLNESKGQDGRISFNWLGLVKIRHLNMLFQIYQKRMPTLGPCLRLERRFSFKKKVH